MSLNVHIRILLFLLNKYIIKKNVQTYIHKQSLSFWSKYLSDFRKTFAGAFNPSTGENEADQMAFPDFVYLLVHGPMELAEYLSQNEVDGQSLGMASCKMSLHW